MDTSQITTMLREGIWIVLKLGGPMLLLSMVVRSEEHTSELQSG